MPLINSVNNIYDVKPYSTANRNGSTSATPNTWTEVRVLTAASRHLFISNPIGSSANLEVGFGSAGTEFRAAILRPGGSAQIGSRDRISVRCTTIASQPYLASEGVYI